MSYIEEGGRSQLAEVAGKILNLLAFEPEGKHIRAGLVTRTCFQSLEEVPHSGMLSISKSKRTHLIMKDDLRPCISTLACDGNKMTDIWS